MPGLRDGLHPEVAEDVVAGIGAAVFAEDAEAGRAGVGGVYGFSPGSELGIVLDVGQEFPFASCVAADAQAEHAVAGEEHLRVAVENHGGILRESVLPAEGEVLPARVAGE